MHPFVRVSILSLAAVAAGAAVPAVAQDAGGHRGYYRHPAIHGDTVVFVAEGDLWTVGVDGGVARRLTTHPGSETSPAISPDGTTIAYTAEYEGPQEVYTIPVAGGLPERRTYEGGRAYAQGWTPDGRVLYATRRWSGLPNYQLVTLETGTGARERLPLEQAWEGVYAGGADAPFIFTRLHPQGSRTKRYQGGTNQSLWSFTGDRSVELTEDWPGTSRRPQWWNGRVWFESDRDGTMNVWSMLPDGSDLRQVTKHAGFDVAQLSVHDGRGVYRVGADLHVVDLATGATRLLDVRLVSDLDQMRERWVKDPAAYLSSAHPSPDGKRVVLTARGRVFIAPKETGRFVEVTRKPGVRYRAARYLPDGKTLIAQTDEPGEIELCTISADGRAEEAVLTSEGAGFRYGPVPSPDGKRVAWAEENLPLKVLDLESRKVTVVATSRFFALEDFAWSPDSRWLAYRDFAPNMFSVLRIWNAEDGTTTTVTSDRNDSYAPAWSPDGKWLWFLSDREFVSTVGSPWGPGQPDPHFENTTKVFGLALHRGEAFPFRAPDEVGVEEAEAKEKAEKEKGKEKSNEPAEENDRRKDEDAGNKDKDKDAVEPIVIDLEGIAARVWEVPVPRGDYGELRAVGDRLWMRSRVRAPKPGNNLVAVEITHDDPELKTIVEGIASFEPCHDGSTVLVRRGNDLFLLDAKGGPGPDLGKAKVDLAGWSFPIVPRAEWRQVFDEAWRLQRDHFYDPDMHGVDWPAVREKYRPLVERVTDRAELADVIGQMLSELSALHTFVWGGDEREDDLKITVAMLGARLEPDAAAGGWVIAHVHRQDPDDPGGRGPLSRPDLDIRTGDVITRCEGLATAGEPYPGRVLRNRAGKRVRLTVKRPSTGEERDVVVTAVAPNREQDLRYDEWELERREMVEEWGGGDVGYVHLRAMGRGDIGAWARQFYPVFDRKGLVIDVRHNGGGNIDSWILGKLLRRAWFYWAPRKGDPYWNMQYAFRGHMVVLVDERTGSDGEAFAEGFRRLGLGQVIGTRTWGGEIWLGMRDWLVDRGFATAAETGVYDADGNWLIEGHGVDPDIVVDNPPHATFKGEDAQLRAGVDHLLERLKEDPVEVPPIPERPNKAPK